MMPTSAIGKRSESGYTLIEMLVVITILGIAGGAILLTAPDSRRTLIDEAERFAAGLERAKEEAVLTNRTVDVQITSEGYTFGVTSRGMHRALDQRPFGSIAWSDDTTAVVSGKQPSRIAFDSTGIATPVEVDLFRSDGHVRVRVDMAGSVKIDVAQR